MTGIELAYYAITFWLIGFVGGMCVLFYDYRSYNRDVKMMEFLENTLWTFIAWPTIIHHIVIYMFRPIFNCLHIDFNKFKNITIAKGRKIDE